MLVTLKYRPSLSEIEFRSWYEVWCSGDERAVAHKYVRAPGPTDSVYLQLPAELPEDAAIMVQTYADVYEKDEREPRCIEAGFARVMLAAALRGEVVSVLDRVALVNEPGIHQRRDTEKGTVAVRAAGAVTFRPVNFALLPETMPRLGARVNAYNDAVRRAALRRPQLYPELARVHVDEYRPLGMPMPTAAFFWNRDAHAPDPAFIRQCLAHGARTCGWTEDALAAALEMVLSADAFTREQVLALNAFGAALTVLCTGLMYVSDYAVEHDPATGRAKLIVVEAFDDAAKRRSGDCEDFARLATALFLVLRDMYAPQTRLDRAAVAVARQYVPCATLLSVLGAQISDTDGLDPLKVQMGDPDVEKYVGAHMRGTLLPVAWVGNLDHHRMGAALDKMPVLLLEGTGMMFAVQQTFCELLGARLSAAVLATLPPELAGWHTSRANPRETMPDDVSCNGFYRVDATYYLVTAGWVAPQLEVSTGDARGATVVSVLRKDPRVKFTFAAPMPDDVRDISLRVAAMLSPVARAKADNKPPLPQTAALLAQFAAAGIPALEMARAPGGLVWHYAVREADATPEHVRDAIALARSSRATQAAMWRMSMAHGASTLNLVIRLK